MSSIRALVASAAYILFLGASDAATVKFVNTQWEIKAGDTIDIQWTGGTGPYALALLVGSAADVTILSNSYSNSARWTPDRSFASGTFKFQITDEADGSHAESPSFYLQGPSSLSARDVFGSGVAASTMTTPQTSVQALASSTSAGPTAVATSTTAGSATRTESPNIPLTTIFTPPISCVGRYYYTSPEPAPILSDSGDRLFASCQPWHNGNSITYTYSPGVCPGGMSIVLSDQNVKVHTEICCQSGYYWQRNVGCCSTVQSPTPVLVAPQISTSDLYTRVSAVTAQHQPITVLWRHEDLSLFPSAVSASRASKEKAAEATPTRDIEPIISPEAPKPEGLSQPAKIGIGIGISLGAILLALALWVFAVARRRRKRDKERTQSMIIDAAAHEADVKYPGMFKRFLGDTWRAELGSSHGKPVRPPTARAELEAPDGRREDPGPSVLSPEKKNRGPPSSVPVELEGSPAYSSHAGFYSPQSLTHSKDIIPSKDV